MMEAIGALAGFAAVLAIFIGAGCVIWWLVERADRPKHGPHVHDWHRYSWPIPIVDEKGNAIGHTRLEQCHHCGAMRQIETYPGVAPVIRMTETTLPAKG